MSKEKYIRITMGNGDQIFVLEKDFKQIGKEMEKKPFNAKKVVGATFQSLLSSPEALSKLSEATMLLMKIMQIDNIGELKGLKRLIASRINALQHKQKVKKDDENFERKIRQSKRRAGTGKGNKQVHKKQSKRNKRKI